MKATEEIKRYIISSIAILLSFFSSAQQDRFFSEDTATVARLMKTANSLRASNTDTSRFLSEKALLIAEKINWPEGIADAHHTLGVCATTKGNYEEAKVHYSKSLEAYTAIEHHNGIAAVHTSIGVIFSRQGNFDEALSHYTTALEISEEQNNRGSVANLLNNIGIVYKNKGDYSTALGYYFKGLKIAEELNNKKVIANCLNNIGLAYYRTDEPDKALEYYFKAIDNEVHRNNKRGLANSYANIGNAYSAKKEYDRALEYYDLALTYAEEIGYINAISNIYANKGIIYLENYNDFEKALDYMNKSLAICEELDNKMGISGTLSSIAEIYIRKNEPDTAEVFLKRALAIATEIQALSMVKNNERDLSDLYVKKGNYKEALEHYKKYIEVRDSIYNEENTKKFLTAQLQFDFDKKEATSRLEYEKAKALAQAELDKKKLLLEKNQKDLALLEKENELKELSLAQSNSLLRQKQIEAENQQNAIELLNKDKLLREAEAREKEEAYERQKMFTYLIAIGGILLLAFLAVVVKGYFEKKRANEEIRHQKKEVEKQKDIVEEKQKEILDSIFYAKRLQDAILPPEKFVRENIRDSFILYKPKDIVAGDFYWMERVKDTVLIAAADCTGHGVPGAMVAVVCSNALNRAVKEFGIHDPGKILDKVRELVIETFEKSESEVKDGMDISLCAISPGMLRWAGANNPLWIIRSGSGKIEQIKPDKQPIGRYATNAPFTTHHLSLDKGDSISLFTDGFADQFGGERGKKFKYGQFEELLLQLNEKAMDVQKSILANTIDKWRGDFEQVDDILVMGLRI